MRVVWSRESLRRVALFGVSPSEVNRVLGARGRRLLLPLTRHDDAEDVLRVISDVTGRLLEVWLVETPERDWYDVAGAFEAGMDGKARWDNAQERELR